MNLIYSSFKESTLIENIIKKKRQEIVKKINQYFHNELFKDALDIGTTSDTSYKHSNYIIKNLKNVKIFKSISDQKIRSKFFLYSLNKSIIEDFSKNELIKFSSEIVVSNATIEHVGSYKNQIKMISNILLLSKKKFVISTPNRFHPIDFHTNIPFIHWLPKKLHRKILSLIGLNFLSREENLNLLSVNDMKKILNRFKNIKYIIKEIKFLGFTSNILVLGRKIKN